VIVNLGLLDPRCCLADEAGLVESLGREYQHVPVDFNAPQSGDLERFFALRDASRNKKVFLALCAQANSDGRRAKRMHTSGVSWKPNDTWTTFIAQSRRRLQGGDGQH
jgi:hypothetical protein